MEQAIIMKQKFFHFLAAHKETTPGYNADLHKTLNTTKTEVKKALLDDFNTIKAIDHMRILIDETTHSEVSYDLLQEIQSYIKRTLTIFNAMETKANEQHDPDKKMLHQFAVHRNNLKKIAGDKGATFKELDNIRNETFPQFGWILKDDKSPDGFILSKK